MNYSAFLASKSTACPPVGFDPSDFTAPLFPFQRDIVTMACRVVIRRGLQLWSNPGDLVLSPFAGIGSEGHVSLQMGRRFVGFELKPSYFNCAVKNLTNVQAAKQSELLPCS